MIPEGHSYAVYGFSENLDWSTLNFVKPVDDIRVSCWNRGNGCETIIDVSSIADHFHRDCAYHCTCCPNCSSTVLRRDIIADLESNCTNYVLNRMSRTLPCEDVSKDAQWLREDLHALESTFRNASQNDASLLSSLQGIAAKNRGNQIPIATMADEVELLSQVMRQTQSEVERSSERRVNQSVELRNFREWLCAELDEIERAAIEEWSCERVTLHENKECEEHVDNLEWLQREQGTISRNLEVKNKARSEDVSKNVECLRESVRALESEQVDGLEWLQREVQSLSNKLEEVKNKTSHEAGLRKRAAEDTFMETGLYNTVQEIIEAQRSNQLLRLSRTPTGRNLLRTLRLEPSGTTRNEEAWSPIPIKVAAHMHLKPLPRNMNPQRHPGRRKARADYYIRWYRNRDDVLYVDAAGVALALAVAHAAADSTIAEICTDSPSAYRYFRQGIAPNTVPRILRNIPSLPHPVTITWVPGHECIPGNERVNAHVRGLSIRTLEDHSLKPVTKPEEGICTYHQITSYYRNGRRDLPAPHYSLTPNQSSVWRQLQTKIFISPYLAHLFYPGLHHPHCTTCGAPRADLFHCLWSCPKPLVVDPIPNRSLSSWEATLRATGSDYQLRLVNRACLETSARGLPDV
ncbi:hypothetical protein HPB52_005243 [Rhipicephalus sanguineus]|uniref:Tick transposon n=1 Tax=Rhipicephalus sanguineus TaxID=34632 RepID=A0A9D4SQC9_RHISA|nr:hypothetical protein HPB52_005243 [Rhipicephalus sanguineus]